MLKHRDDFRPAQIEGPRGTKVASSTRLKKGRGIDRSSIGAAQIDSGAYVHPFSQLQDLSSGQFQPDETH